MVQIRVRHPVRFEVNGCALHGMLDLPPKDVHRRGVGVLFLNSDDGCRMGPHGLWIRLADRLAAEGFPCLRFDYRGCGDSEGSEGPPPGVVGLTDAIAAERVLRAQAGVKASVVVGICYGAEIGLLAARCLPSIHSVVACSAGRYVTSAGYGQSLREAARYAKAYLGRLIVADTWSRLVRGDVRAGVVLRGFLQRLSWLRRRRERRGAVAAEALAGRPGRCVPQLFVYGGADPLMSRHMPDYRLEAERRGIDRRFMVIGEADHNFSSVAWAQEVIEAAVALVFEIGCAVEKGDHGDARNG